MTRPDEARRIYFAIFRKKIPPTLEVHFNKISPVLEDRHPSEQVQAYQYVLDHVRDLDALELVSRYLGRLPVLTEKFRVMAYLGETVPENYECFVNDKTRRVFAYARVFRSVVVSVVKFVKGLILFATNGLC